MAPIHIPAKHIPSDTVVSRPRGGGFDDMLLPLRRRNTPFTECFVGDETGDESAAAGFNGTAQVTPMMWAPVHFFRWSRGTVTLIVFVDLFPEASAHSTVME